ncbi:hypothetical protein P7K49_026941, partial [Saguinus oedipus]
MGIRLQRNTWNVGSVQSLQEPVSAEDARAKPHKGETVGIRSLCKSRQHQLQPEHGQKAPDQGNALRMPCLQESLQRSFIPQEPRENSPRREALCFIRVEKSP